MIKIGKGWAPEVEPSKIDLESIRELRILLDKLFDSKTGLNQLRGR